MSYVDFFSLLYSLIVITTFYFIFFYKIVYKIDIIDIELKISKLAKNIST